MGRADQATKVRGMFVHPTQIEEIVRRHNEIGAARMIVSRDAQGNDEMVLNIEAQTPIGDPMRILDTLHAVTRLRGRVVQVPIGSLPKDGIMVADTRKYE
jgi:phenylacetate-CoA ligase